MKVHASDNPVEAAIAEGKILPDRREIYLKLMEKDPEGTRRTLAKIEPVFVDGLEPEPEYTPHAPPPRPRPATATEYPKDWVRIHRPGSVTFEDPLAAAAAKVGPMP